MNRAFAWGLLSLAAVLWTSGESLAFRGPGRGGPGPGARGAGTLGSGGPGLRSPGSGSHVKPEALEGFLGTREAAGSRGQAIQNWEGQRYKPFTPAWYAHHPAAWQATHPHADAWVAATAAGVAAWLAVPYASVSGGTTYVTETSETSTEATATATANPTANATTPETPANAQPSENLTGLDAAGQWLSLGVFALGPKGEKETNRVVQLAVGKDGQVRGAYVDTVTGAEEDITGSVNKKTVQIRWQVGAKGIAFESALGEFTKPQGSVTATLPGGKTAAWQVSQIKK